jgi:hypothetical protein
MRPVEITNPVKGPCILKASMANCEQVGTCRHEGAINGDISHLYSQTGISSRKDNIFAGVFVIRSKDKMNRHDKMTCLNLRTTMADILLKRKK